MKKRHLLLVALSLILSICMCFSLAACSSCNDEKEAPTALTTPVVTIDDKGVASWAKVENARGYAYKIDDGTEVETSELSRQLTDGQKISVKAKGDGESYTDSAWSVAKTYTAPAPQPTKLTKPVITLEDNVVSWTADPNASKYQFSPNNGRTWIDVAGNSVTLNASETATIIVKAIGNGTTYSDSDPSDPVTYTAPAPQPQKLSTPSVTIDENGLAKWAAIPNALKYETKINGQDSYTNDLVRQLQTNDTIQVRAIGDGETYTDSDWSEEKTCTQSIVDPQPALTKPVLALEGNVIHWTADINASGYQYSLDNGATWKDVTGNSITLTESATVIVKAIGDGMHYTDSPVSDPITYTASTVDPDPDPDPDPIDPALLTAETTIKDYATAHGWVSDGTKYKQVELDDYITVTANGGSNTGKYYTKNEQYDWRIYSSENPVITITAKTGYTLVSVTITYTSDQNGSIQQKDEQGLVGEELISPAEIKDINSNNLILTVVGVDDKGKKGIAQITEIKVTYKRVAVALPAPELTVDDYGVATWTEVPNAFGYAYQINEGEIVKIGKDAERKYDKLTNGQTIKVWAIGNEDEFYLDSSVVEKTYTQTPLAPPTVTVDEAGLANWELVDGASSYKYILLDKDNNKVGEGELLNGAHTHQLQDGQKIQVMSVGKGLYISSEYSAPSELFNAPANKDVCDIPEIKVYRDGKVEISAVEGAGSYKYILNTDGVDAEPVVIEKLKDLENLDLTLSDGQSIKVMAVGNNVTHTDSTYSAVITYQKPKKLDAPTVTFTLEGSVQGKVIVSWQNDENATGYVYILNNDAPVTVTENSVTLALKEDDTFKVMAVNNNIEIATDGNYSGRFTDSEYSAVATFAIDNEKTYTVSEILPIINYYGTTLSDKPFKVSGVVLSNTAVFGKDNNQISITLKDSENENNKVILHEVVVSEGFEYTGIDYLEDLEITATGNVKIANKEARFTAPEIEIALKTENRFFLADIALTAMKDEIQAEHSENFTLPVNLFGARVTWVIDPDEAETVKDIFVIDNETGAITVTPSTELVEFFLSAELSIENEKYAEDILFAITIPADTGEIKAIFEPSDWASVGNSNSVKDKTITKKDITITFNSDTKYYTTELRWYSKNTFTVNAENLYSVELIFSGNDKVTASVGNYSNKKWTAPNTPVNSVTFTNSDSAQCKITQILVICRELTDAVKSDLDLEALNDINGNYTANSELALADFTGEKSGFNIHYSVEKNTTEGNGDGTFVIGTDGKVTITQGTTETTFTVTATISCTCSNANHKHTREFTEVKVLAEGAPTESETVKVIIADYASTHSWKDATQYKSATINEIITAKAAGGGNTGKYYEKNSSWRLYSSENAKLTIEAQEGYIIESVKLIFHSTDSPTIQFNSNICASDTAIDINSTSATFAVTAGKAHITAIEVTYKAVV